MTGSEKTSQRFDVSGSGSRKDKAPGSKVPGLEFFSCLVTGFIP